MQAYKRILATYRDNKALDGKEMNSMITDSCEQAFEKLDVTDQYYVKKNQDILVKQVKDLGEKSALELLAAVGDYLNGLEE
jgi:hypothetical protein